MEAEDENRQERGRGYFVTTRWSIIAASQNGRSEEEKSRDALAQLCRIYWQPVHDFICRKGYSPADAQDLAQDFVMKIISPEFLNLANRERGKFRGFLLKSLQNFLINTHKVRQRTNDVTVSIELLGSENGLVAQTSGWTAEGMFDVGWASTVSERALTALREECVLAGREKVYLELGHFLSNNVDEWDHQKASRVLGVPLPTVRTLVSRLRERYRVLLRAEIAETVHDTAEIDDELRYLYRLLAEGGPA